MRISDWSSDVCSSDLFSVPRLKLAERSRQALAEIGNSVAGVQLPRLKAIEALDLALDQHRFVEISGGTGVGKSAVLKHAAERIAGQANVLVLDPVSKPAGGWRSAERRVGQEGVRTGICRWASYHQTKNNKDT